MLSVWVYLLSFDSKQEEKSTLDALVILPRGFQS